RKLEAAGVGRADLRGLDDLALVPTTVKDELRRSEEEHPPFGDYRGAPIEACVRLGASTGTSGRPTLILWTRKDHAAAHAARARGVDPERDLNLRVAGDHPAEQYLMVSSGLEALPLLGSACDERDGAHLAEDLAIVEVIDRRTGRACGDGERGNLVVTVLEKDNFLLRYDLEDLVRWNAKP